MLLLAWRAWRWRRVIASLLAGLVVLVAITAGLLTIAVGAVQAGNTAPAANVSVSFGCLEGGASDALAGMTTDQKTIAATIVQVAHDRGLPPRAAIIGAATAYQESKFVNYLHHTDNTTSLGILGQMTIYYGYEVATTPALAIGAFYDRLIVQPSWQTRPLTDVAADVQRPYEPYRGLYAQWEGLATRITAQLWGDCQAVGAGVKHASSGRIVRDGEEIDCITNAVLDAVVAAVGTVRIAQGSWNSRDVPGGISGGTHHGAGAVDFSPLSGDYVAAERVARAAGGIAWHRTPAQGFEEHIHMVIDEAGLSPEARAQVDGFLQRHDDGLGGPEVDHGPPYTPYAGLACAA